MSGGVPDIRALTHAVCYPTSNDAYIRDQKTLTDLFKEPGELRYDGPPGIGHPDANHSGFFIALQGYALDKSLSQHERLFASVITGREMKTKWRSKLSVRARLETNTEMLKYHLQAST